MHIYVQTLVGKTFTLEVEPSDTIVSIKQKIQEMEGILPSRQILILGSIQLEDSRMLNEYDYQRHAKLHLVVRRAIKVPEEHVTCCLW